MSQDSGMTLRHSIESPSVPIQREGAAAAPGEVVKQLHLSIPVCLCQSALTDAATTAMVGLEEAVPHIFLCPQTRYGKLRYLVTVWLLDDCVALLAPDQLARYKRQLGIKHMRKDSQVKKEQRPLACAALGNLTN